MTDARFAEDGREFYVPDGPVLTGYVLSNRFVDVIEGPLGSGKTKGSCIRLMRHAQEQAPSLIDGIRKTRWAVVRNTYDQLKRTTVRTWLDCFPEDIYGRLNRAQPYSHHMRFGDVDTQADFLALDKPEDVRKLRSGEYTGFFFNEISFIDKEIFDEATSRVGRYPSVRDGGATWAGVIADGNAPDEDHWFAMMTGQVDLPPGMLMEEMSALKWPQDWGFHKQAPALLEDLDERGLITGYRVNPKTENLRWLPPDYYAKMIPGKSRAWIDSRLMVRVVLVVDGSPVYPMFRREFHVSREVLRPVIGHLVTVSLDFGRMPGALFSQQINARIFVQHELQGMNEGAVTFAPKVKRILEQHYAGCQFQVTGDPKGQDKGQADERTAYDIFQANGMKVTPCPVKGNSIKTRVDTVSYSLNDNPSGINRLVISPGCRTLVVGLAGRYCLEREEDGELKPTKNRYSHLCNCLEYGLIFQGEGRRMIGLTPIGLSHPVQYHKGRKSMRRILA